MYSVRTARTNLYIQKSESLSLADVLISDMFCALIFRSMHKHVIVYFVYSQAYIYSHAGETCIPSVL